MPRILRSACAATFLLGALTSIPAFPSLAGAAVLLQPGETSARLDFTGCEKDDNCIAKTNCDSDCDGLAENEAHAAVTLSNFTIGRKFALSSLYTDVEIASTPETAGNLIACTIRYDVEWRGLWAVAGVFTADNKGKMELVFFLEDMTDGGRKVITRQIQETEPNTVSAMDISAGGWVDRGRKRDSFTALVERGHTYRIRFTLRIEAIGLANGSYNLDYQSGNRGAQWHDLRVSLGQDATELVAGIETRIDTLEQRLENHGHTYLTGRGVGHNNTEATTGLAIFFDDAPPGSEETVLDPPGNGRAPRSVLHPNFPNPTRPTTTISFTLEEPSPVRVELFDASGRRIRVLAEGAHAAGEHRLELDAGSLASGVYFYKLTADGIEETRKLVVAR